MLYGEQAVRDNIRNRDGKRVFFLGSGDRLSPAAQDFLRREKIEIRPASSAAIDHYEVDGGGTTKEKPEYMTHLRGNILISKTHPIVAFRGAMDTLQAELLLTQLVVAPSVRQKLEEILGLCRSIIAWDVMQEPAHVQTLCGLTAAELRSHSHRPQDFYGQPHFMPSYTDGMAILQLNRTRCAARNAELAAARAFEDATGGCARSDILTLLNRMSSMLYILMIQLKAGQ